MKYNESESYLGEWKDNYQEGLGVELRCDYAYKGEFKKGMKEGLGNAIYKNGDYYYGGWVRNHKSGYGSFLSSNGDNYIGCMAYNKYEGYGELMHTKKREVYCGYFKNGDKEGIAVLYSYPNELLEICYFKAGKRDGPGISISSQSKLYIVWKSDKKISIFQSSQELLTNFSSAEKKKRVNALLTLNNNKSILKSMLKGKEKSGQNLNFEC